jgi:hypothetical protein
MGEGKEGQVEPAEWMEPALDHEILESVRDRGAISIHDFDTIDADTHNVLNRVQILLGYGLLGKQDNEIFLTEWGEGYLQGELAGVQFQME